MERKGYADLIKTADKESPRWCGGNDYFGKSGLLQLISPFFLGEKLSPLVWTGIIISVSGIAIIALVKGTDGERIGYLALLIAMTAMAIYFVF